jgi:hypothetical protein
MSDQALRDAAQAGYIAYGDSVGWKNYAGLPMPTWAELPERIRQAWMAATEGIRRWDEAVKLGKALAEGDDHVADEPR